MCLWCIFYRKVVDIAFYACCSMTIMTIMFFLLYVSHVILYLFGEEYKECDKNIEYWLIVSIIGAFISALFLIVMLILFDLKRFNCLRETAILTKEYIQEKLEWERKQNSENQIEISPRP